MPGSQRETPGFGREAKNNLLRGRQQENGTKRFSQSPGPGGWTFNTERSEDAAPKVQQGQAVPGGKQAATHGPRSCPHTGL